MKTAIPITTLSPLWERYEVWFPEEPLLGVVSTVTVINEGLYDLARFPFDGKSFAFLFSKEAYYERKKCVLDTIEYLDEAFRPGALYECVHVAAETVTQHAGEGLIFLLDANLKELIRKREHIVVPSNVPVEPWAKLVM